MNKSPASHWYRAISLSHSWVFVAALSLIFGAVFAFPAFSEEPVTVAPDDEGVAVMTTSMGTMVFRLFESGAPATVANFRRLVGEGFYDGQPFYRVVVGHVIQAGDGGNSGQPTVKGEFGAHPHVVGALGLARGADPDSGNTEIYVCHAPRAYLDGSYAVFGLLIEGFDILEAIAKVEVDEKWDGKVAFHRPKKPVTIEKISLERRPQSND